MAHGIPLTRTQTPGNVNIQLAIREQSRMGWHGMINGFISRKWRTVQHDRLNKTKSTLSAITWMALFQRRIWIIPWELWEHRNQILHQQKTLHPTEIDSLNNEISIEWIIGLDDLPRTRYAHLFRGTLTHQIKDTPHFKQLWLASVWAARDSSSRNHRTPPIRARNAIASSFYQQWKDRLEND